MNESVLGERSKPTWLTYYGLYLWIAVLLSIATMYRFAGESSAIGGGVMVARAGLFSFAIYSLRHWEAGWVRKLHFWMNGGVAILGLLYLTPFAVVLPSIFHFIFAAVSVPIYTVIPYQSLLATSPLLASALRFVMLAIAAYWTVCWRKSIP